MTSSERSEADVLEQERAVRPAEDGPDDATEEMAPEVNEADALEQRSPADDPGHPDDEYPGG